MSSQNIQENKLWDVLFQIKFNDTRAESHKTCSMKSKHLLQPIYISDTFVIVLLNFLHDSLLITVQQ